MGEQNPQEYLENQLNTMGPTLLEKPPVLLPWQVATKLAKLYKLCKPTTKPSTSENCEVWTRNSTGDKISGWVILGLNGTKKLCFFWLNYINWRVFGSGWGLSFWKWVCETLTSKHFLKRRVGGWGWVDLDLFGHAIDPLGWVRHLKHPVPSEKIRDQRRGEEQKPSVCFVFYWLASTVDGSELRRSPVTSWYGKHPIICRVTYMLG